MKKDSSYNSFVLHEQLMETKNWQVTANVLLFAVLGISFYNVLGLFGLFKDVVA